MSEQCKLKGSMDLTWFPFLTAASWATLVFVDVLCRFQKIAGHVDNNYILTCMLCHYLTHCVYSSLLCATMTYPMELLTTLQHSQKIKNNAMILM